MTTWSTKTVSVKTALLIGVALMLGMTQGADIVSAAEENVLFKSRAWTLSVLQMDSGGLVCVARAIEAGPNDTFLGV